MISSRRSKRNTPRLPLWKRVAFSVFLVLIVWAAFELASFAAFGLVTGETFSWSAAQGFAKSGLPDVIEQLENDPAYAGK